MMGGDIFMRAQWRDLVILNFEVDPEILEPFTPLGTEIDEHRGSSYLSMVGFQFSHPRLLGIPIPLHSQFPEVNLRCYVRRRVRDQWRRGVVFIREMVPRWLVSTVAREIFQENFRCLPVTGNVEYCGQPTAISAAAEYACQYQGDWQRLAIQTDTPFAEPETDSLNQFIVEHYFAYSTRRDGTSREYQVDHPRWKIASASEVTWDFDANALFGPVLGEALGHQPASAFLADGSAVAVHRGKIVTLPQSHFAKDYVQTASVR